MMALVPVRVARPVGGLRPESDDALAQPHDHGFRVVAAARSVTFEKLRGRDDGPKVDSYRVEMWD